MLEKDENSTGQLCSHEIFEDGKLEQWNDKGYRIEKYGQEFSVLIFGEGHSDRGQQAKQIELIRAVGPEYVLHEFLGAWIYNPKTRKLEKPKDRQIDEFEDDLSLTEIESEIPGFISLANGLGFKIIGCDLTNAETWALEREIASQNPDKYTYDDELEMLRKIDGPNYIITFTSEEFSPFRDAQMVKIIHQYQQKSIRPVIAIIGAHHGNNIHSQKLLQGYGLGYAYIDQDQTAVKEKTQIEI